jgi:hypothetical protein
MLDIPKKKIKKEEKNVYYLHLTLRVNVFIKKNLIENVLLLLYYIFYIKI